MTEPTTAAGRALLDDYRRWFAQQGWSAEGWDAAASSALLANDIAAIEAEARAEADAQNVALVRAVFRRLLTDTAPADLHANCLQLDSAEAAERLAEALLSVVRQFLPSGGGGLYEHEDGTWHVNRDWKWAAHNLLAALRREPPREGSAER